MEGWLIVAEFSSAVLWVRWSVVGEYLFYFNILQPGFLSALTFFFFHSFFFFYILQP